jgi:hypothetical protein
MCYYLSVILRKLLTVQCSDGDVANVPNEIMVIAHEFRFTFDEVMQYFELSKDLGRTRIRFQRGREQLAQLWAGEDAF